MRMQERLEANVAAARERVERAAARVAQAEVDHEATGKWTEEELRHAAFTLRRLEAILAVRERDLESYLARRA